MVNTVTLFFPNRHIYSISTKLLSIHIPDNLYLTILINISFISTKVKTLFVLTYETCVKQSLKEPGNKPGYKLVIPQIPLYDRVNKICKQYLSSVTNNCSPCINSQFTGLPVTLCQMRKCFRAIFFSGLPPVLQSYPQSYIIFLFIFKSITKI